MLPDTGWIVAGVLFVLYILRDVLKDSLTRFFKWLAERLYNHLAGYKPFWLIALHRYRRALVREHQELKIPFRPGRPLRMRDIYVPLKVTGSGNRALVDAHTALGQHPRLMVVVGEPGSGKTMLMRHVARSYAREGLHNFDGQPIPILLELDRLNDPSETVLAHLTAALGRHDFPNAQSFVKSGLKHGFLMLLFDGLDEVNQEAREPVVRQIKDLLQGSDCRVVVTCRTWVYKNEFDDWNDQRLDIVEFDDRQIQRFLNAWEPEMPAGKSVEHLLHTLRERPHIMALARNPLLLTIIAYLYSDTAFMLPHSRTEFYERSTTALLDQWDRFRGKRNQYKAGHKRLVLQGLALYYQERAATQREDRRSAALTDVLAETKNVLPSLNLAAEHAGPLLGEIVARSGLLLALDGGTRYQFTHLTLQEFFAALALKDKPDQLIARFEADPNTWRESAKLWCGLEHDSTTLIEAVAAADPITALECLGDAQQVDADYAADLIQSFQIRLARSDPDWEAATRALALVAANPRPRGEAVLNNLAATLSSPAATPEIRLAAAQVLSLTNLPQAADVLAEHAPRDPALRPLLAQMGNLAVPALKEWAARGEAWALDALYAVGTPQAALALTRLLWNADQTTQHQAAWRLSALLPDPNVEAALNNFTLAPEHRRADYMDWVWAPFEPDPESPLRVVGGRVAYLLHTATENTLPPYDLSLGVDARLAVPLCAVVAAQDNKLKNPEREENPVWLRRDNPVWRYLFCSLAPSQQSALRRCLLERKLIPTQSDWRNIFRPKRYSFHKSPQDWGFRLSLVAMVCLSLWQIGVTVLEAPQLVTGEYGEYGIIVLLGLALALGLLGAIRGALEAGAALRSVFLFSILVTALVVGPIVAALGGNVVTGAIVVALLAALLGAIAYAVHAVGAEALLGAAFGAVLSAFFSAPIGALFGALFSAVSGALFGAVSSVASGARLGAVGVAFVSASVGARLGAGLVTDVYIDQEAGVPLNAVGAAVTALMIYFPAVWLSARWGWVGTSVFWTAWLVWMMGFLVWGARLDRRARNPLQGLLDVESAPGVEYRGVLAGRGR